jgi:hypothetical protein
MTDLDLAAKSHARFSASSAHRWLNCRGSVRLIESLNLPRETNIYGAEGSFAHAYAAKCLETGTDAWEYAGEEGEYEGFPFAVDAEMVEGIQVYLDAVRAIEGGLQVEVQGTLGEGFEDCAGTSDAVAVAPKLYSIVDFKYGAGLGVEPDDNSQLKIYAAIATKNMKSKQAVAQLGIVQPRKPHPKGPVRFWDISLADLRAWVEGTLKPAILEAREPGAPLAVGDWCRWCPAFEHCPEQKSRTKMIVARIQDEGAPAVEAMEPWEIGEMLDLWPLIQQHFRSLSERAFEMMLKGVKIPGQKIVAGRASRTYKDGAAAAAETELGAVALSTPMLLSPAQLEKVGPEGKKFVSEWAYKVPGRPTMAKVSDPKPEVVVDKTDPNATFGDMV